MNFANTDYNQDTYLIWQGATALANVTFTGISPKGFTGDTNNSTFNIPPFTRNTIVSLFNVLNPEPNSSYGIISLGFKASSYVLLTDEDKTIATDKGWSIYKSS